jgi:hypothetical protein
MKLPTQCDCNLVRWSRIIPDYVLQALALWAAKKPDNIEHVIHSPLVGAILTEADLPGDVTSWLESDLTSLSTTLFDIAKPHALVVRFCVIDSDQCRKFHVDYLRYRLLATYLGPGTEWVPDEYVDRAALSNPPVDPTAANAVIVKDSNEIRRAAAGDVLLMKGARHPHGVGLVHRSPPIEGTGRARVLLTLSTRDRC